MAESRVRGQGPVCPGSPEDFQHCAYSVTEDSGLSSVTLTEPTQKDTGCKTSAVPLGGGAEKKGIFSHGLTLPRCEATEEAPDHCGLPEEITAVT